MDENPWEDDYKTSGQNLQKYLKNNKSKIPFIV
jgi:hypothetical protein